MRNDGADRFPMTKEQMSKKVNSGNFCFPSQGLFLGPLSFQWMKVLAKNRLLMFS